MKKNHTLMAIVLVLIIAAVLGYRYLLPEEASETAGTGNAVRTAQESDTAGLPEYLLEGYPLTDVPLYRVRSVSSSKFFVNRDPSRRADYFGSRIHYYNVVFETESDAPETLRYYTSLMTERNTQSVPADRAEGTIGRYKVSVSQYADAPKKEIYLQVYLPEAEFSGENPYYGDYPNIVEVDPSWLEYESSYGLLNQKGGEVEYTQYFPLPEKEEDQDTLIREYREKLGSASGYSFDEKSGLMRWKTDPYSISLTFSKDHGRIYLMVRKPM